ncbi:hypothetical protein LXA43DRAFT_1068910 [Ganoderma leucocontextum]|nr:hypothetical protein LXA43DRAFT_1068910 [Ganoderma leucocontextum]
MGKRHIIESDSDDSPPPPSQVVNKRNGPGDEGPPRRAPIREAAKNAHKVWDPIAPKSRGQTADDKNRSKVEKSGVPKPRPIKKTAAPKPKCPPPNIPLDTSGDEDVVPRTQNSASSSTKKARKYQASETKLRTSLSDPSKAVTKPGEGNGRAGKAKMKAVDSESESELEEDVNELLASSESGSESSGLEELEKKDPSAVEAKFATERATWVEQNEANDTLGLDDGHIPSPIHFSLDSPEPSLAGSPARSPVLSPTRSPILSPARSPILSPARSPVESHTRLPIRSHTHSRIPSPIRSPNQSPIRSPNQSPTHSPVQSPTHSPVQSHTRSPVRSHTPSCIPSHTPSRIPSPVRSPTVSALHRLSDKHQRDVSSGEEAPSRLAPPPKKSKISVSNPKEDDREKRQHECEKRREQERAERKRQERAQQKEDHERRRSEKAREEHEQQKRAKEREQRKKDKEREEREQRKKDKEREQRKKDKEREEREQRKKDKERKERKEHEQRKKGKGKERLSDEDVAPRPPKQKRKRQDEEIKWVQTYPEEDYRPRKRSNIKDDDSDLTSDCDDNDERIDIVCLKGPRPNLNDQYPRVYRVAVRAIKEVETHIGTVNAFPEGEADGREYLRNILIKHATALNYKEMVKRLRDDKGKKYWRKFASIPGQRVSLLRGRIKKLCEGTVRATYGLTIGDSAKMTWLLKGIAYTYPHDYTAQSVVRNQPFSLPIFVDMLQIAFFSKRTSYGHRISHLFMSSLPDQPDEKEISAAMLGLISTAIYAAIDDFKFDRYEAQKFEANMFIQAYRKNLENLSKIKIKNTAAYHRLMHDLYIRVTGPAGGSSAAIDSMDYLDIEGMT